MKEKSILRNEEVLKVLKVFNSLASGKCGSNFKGVISEHILAIYILSMSCEIALRWMPQDPIDN